MCVLPTATNFAPNNIGARTNIWVKKESQAISL